MALSSRLCRDESASLITQQNSKSGFQVLPYSWDGQAMKGPIPSFQIDISPFSRQAIVIIMNTKSELIQQLGWLNGITGKKKKRRKEQKTDPCLLHALSY